MNIRDLDTRQKTLNCQIFHTLEATFIYIHTVALLYTNNIQLKTLEHSLNTREYREKKQIKVCY